MGRFVSAFYGCISSKRTPIPAYQSSCSTTSTLFTQLLSSATSLYDELENDYISPGVTDRLTIFPKDEPHYIAN